MFAKRKLSDVAVNLPCPKTELSFRCVSAQIALASHGILVEVFPWLSGLPHEEKAWRKVRRRRKIETRCAADIFAVTPFVAPFRRLCHAVLFRGRFA